METLCNFECAGFCTPALHCLGTLMKILFDSLKLIRECSCFQLVCEKSWTLLHFMQVTSSLSFRVFEKNYKNLSFGSWQAISLIGRNAWDVSNLNSFLNVIFFFMLEGFFFPLPSLALHVRHWKSHLALWVIFFSILWHFKLPLNQNQSSC